MRVYALISIYICSLLALLLSTTLNADWFNSSPLQKTYQALVQNTPDLAWQELQLGLAEEDIKEKHWLPIKREILAQTECGRRLKNPLKLPDTLAIDFISRTNSTQLAYQVKLSVESVTKPTLVSLIGPQGNAVVTANFNTVGRYTEFESSELVIKPSHGLYQLNVDNQQYPLLIAGIDKEPWLKIDTTQTTPKLRLNLPEAVNACPPAAAYWQWFDQDYKMIGSRQPIMTITDGETIYANLPEKSPPPPFKLAAVVNQIEYQAGVKISYIHRISVPYR